MEDHTPDYRKMYFKLLNGITEATHSLMDENLKNHEIINALLKLQKDTAEMFIE